MKKDQQDLEIEFTQRNKERQNEDNKFFLTSAVVAITVLNLEKELKKSLIQTIFATTLGGLKATTNRMTMNSRKGYVSHIILLTVSRKSYNHTFKKHQPIWGKFILSSVHFLLRLNLLILLKFGGIILANLEQFQMKRLRYLAPIAQIKKT